MSASPYDDLVPNDKPEPGENNMNPKPLIKSKTFWANLITAAVGILVAVAGSDIIQQNPEYAGYAATAIAVMNVILRLMTKSPVTLN